MAVSLAAGPNHRSAGETMSIDTQNGHPAMDYRAHEATWAGVVRLTKFMIVLIALILILMAIFLL